VSPSNRPRGLREQRPDLFFASRRRRARDAAGRAAVVLSGFLGALVRRQGQAWRAVADDLRQQLGEAKKDQLALRDAVRTRDEAQRQRDRLRHALGQVRLLIDPAGGAPQVERALDVIDRVLGISDPDPRQGRPGGTEL
jgi:hypothetical protein